MSMINIDTEKLKANHWYIIKDSSNHQIKQIIKIIQHNDECGVALQRVDEYLIKRCIFYNNISFATLIWNKRQLMFNEIIESVDNEYAIKLLNELELKYGKLYRYFMNKFGFRNYSLIIDLIRNKLTNYSKNIIQTLNS